MSMLLNVLPAQRPPLPTWVNPFCGPCSAHASLGTLAPFLNLSSSVQEDRSHDSHGGGAAEGSVLGMSIALVVALAALLGVSIALVRARRRLRAAQAQAQLGWGQDGALGLGAMAGKGEGVTPGAGSLLLAPEGQGSERSAPV